MADDNALKSSFELAMERLKQKDAEAGIESRPLTDEQKAAITEIRNFYEAKLAQEDVLHQSKARMIMDVAERDELDRQFRGERAHLIAERDGKIAKIRSGQA